METSQIVQRMLHAVSTVGVKYTFESLYNRQKLQLNPLPIYDNWLFFSNSNTCYQVNINNFIILWCTLEDLLIKLNFKVPPNLSGYVLTFDWLWSEYRLSSWVQPTQKLM